MKNGTHRYDDRVEICIPMQPITKKNSQQIRKKKTVSKGKYVTVPFIAPSDQFIRYQKDAAFFLKPLRIDYPMNIEAHYYMKTKGVVDLTNLHEAIHDTMVKTGTIVDDEAYFIVSTDGSRVHYDKDNPRTEIIITPTEPTFPMRPKLEKELGQKIEAKKSAVTNNTKKSRKIIRKKS